MGFRVNVSGVKSIDELTGINEPKDGRYHVVVQSVDDSLQKHTEAIVMEFQVLKGTMPGQEGKVHKEFFSTKDAAADRLSRAAIALGLIKPGDPEMEIQFSQAIGRQVIIEVKESEYQGKKYMRMTFMGIWPIGHKEVNDVPLDREALKVAAANVAAPIPGGPEADPWGKL